MTMQTIQTDVATAADVARETSNRLEMNVAFTSMDRSDAALDPTAVPRDGESSREHRDSITISIVTHPMQQAACISRRTAMFHPGRQVEENDPDNIFTNPDDRRAQDHVPGHFG